MLTDGNYTSGAEDLTCLTDEPLCYILKTKICISAIIKKFLSTSQAMLFLLKLPHFYIYSKSNLMLFGEKNNMSMWGTLFITCGL